MGDDDSWQQSEKTTSSPEEAEQNETEAQQEAEKPQIEYVV